MQFQLYSTIADRLDAPGAGVSLDDEAFKPLPPIHIILKGATGGSLDVSLVASLTEGGTLEKILGARETWRLPVLRELWTPLFSGVSKRRRSVDHEKMR